LKVLTFHAQSLDPQVLAKSLQNSGAGALVSFEGWVRSTSSHGTVAAILYEAYEELSRAEFDKIVKETRQRYNVLSIHCGHRTGRVPAGEPAVWVGVLAVHRREAFQACEKIMDELKARLPIWKKEIYTDGNSRWIDYAQS
jgi:molybdopterin synthase catalytic subunit